MAKSGNVHVKLTADVSEYVTALQQATAATSGLAEILRSLGVAEADMPSAIRAVLKIVHDGDGDEAAAIPA